MEPHFDHRFGWFRADCGRTAGTGVRQKLHAGELAVWSWVGQGEETAVDSWTRTQTGLCVIMRVLPRNAPPPVRVGTMSADDYAARLVEDSPPVIRSDWDVYLIENSLIYVRNPCSPEDVEPEFFLHVDPVDMNDLPNHRKQHGFDGFNFVFRNHLLIEGGVCVARRELRDFAYAIAAVRTGQFNGDGQIWNGGFDLRRVGGRRESRAVNGGIETAPACFHYCAGSDRFGTAQAVIGRGGTGDGKTRRRRIRVAFSERKTH